VASTPLGFGEPRGSVLKGRVVDHKVDSLENKTDSLELKIDALEHTMTEGFRLVREEIKMLNFAGEIDDLRERMKRVEQKLGL
jgi:hypothetical protein